jgi:antitoxin PrlF
MPTATLTSKGQITIPLEVRERLGLKAGDRIDFQLGPAGEVVLTSKRIPFEQIRGMLRSSGQKPVSLREMDKGIERAVHARWKRAARRVK